jgi:hypothetical protein
MPIHPLDKDWRQSLKGRSRGLPSGRRTGLHRSLCRRTCHRQGRKHHLLHRVPGLGRGGHQADQARHRHHQHAEHPSGAIAASHGDARSHARRALIFGISPGGLLSDAELFGNLDANRNEMFLESINQVLEIWASEPPYNFQGKILEHLDTKDPDRGHRPGLIARPLQRPHPPIVVTAVAPFSKGVTEAAARGWDPISANFLMPAWVKSHWPKYVEGCERGGRPPIPRTGASPKASLSPRTPRRQRPTRPIRTDLTSIITARCSPS